MEALYSGGVVVLGALNLGYPISPIERRRREFHAMVANIGRPGLSQFGKPRRIGSEQGAARLLESRKVSGHGGHEAVGGLAGLADAIVGGVVATGLLDQFSQCDGSSAGLGAEPFPVPRQEGDLAGDDAELWPSRASRRGRRLRCVGLLIAGRDFFGGSTQIQFDLLAGRVIENQDRLITPGVDDSSGCQRDFRRLAASDEVVALE
jgi:hypothetical protein